LITSATVRWLRRAGLFGLVIAAFFGGAVLYAMRPGDPMLFPAPTGTETHTIYLVSHGLHVGIAIPAHDLAQRARQNGWPALLQVIERFGPHAYLEFGWGEDGFYRGIPILTDVTFFEAARALLAPNNRSVLHVVGLGWHSPQAAFPSLEQKQVALSPVGFDRLLAGIDETFARDETGQLQELSMGLYGPSLFFAAKGTFSILNVCNHWIADLLNRAGVPTNRILSTLPIGLFWDLGQRAGIRPGAA
jgi:uncharacterized protein (TIGR02117 family)